MFKYRNNGVQSDKNLKNEHGQVYETPNIRLAKLLKALLESNYFYETFDVEEQLSLLNVPENSNLSENLKKCLQNISANMYHPSVQKLLTENQSLVLPAGIYKNDMSPVVALNNVQADEWYAKQNTRPNTENSERIQSEYSIGNDRSAENISVRKRVIIYDSDSEDERPKRGRKIAAADLRSDDQMWNNIPAENSSDTTDTNVQMPFSTERSFKIENKSKATEVDGEIICLSDDDEDKKQGDLELKLLFQKHYKVDPRPKVVAVYFKQMGSTCLRNMLFELKKHSIPVEFKNSDTYYVQFIKKKSYIRNCSGDMTFWSYGDCVDIDNCVEPTIDVGNALNIFNKDDDTESVASSICHKSENSLIPYRVVDTTTAASEISILKKLLIRRGSPTISDAREIEGAENVSNYTNSDLTAPQTAQSNNSPTPADITQYSSLSPLNQNQSEIHTNGTEETENFDRRNENASIMGTIVHSTDNQTANPVDTLPLIKKRRAKRKTLVMPNTKSKKGKNVENSDDSNAQQPTMQSKKLNITANSQDLVTPEDVVQSNDVVVKKRKASRKSKISIMQPLIERLTSKKSGKCTNRDESGLSELNQLQSDRIGFPKGNKRNAKKAKVANVQMAQSQNSTSSEMVPETTVNDVVVEKTIRIYRNRIPNISILQQMKLNTTVQSTKQVQQCTNMDEPTSLGVNHYQGKTVGDAANSSSTNAKPAVMHAKKLNTNSVTHETVVQAMVVGPSEDVQLCTNTKESNLPGVNQAKTFIILSANMSGPKKPRDVAKRNANNTSQLQNSTIAKKQTTVNNVNVPALNQHIVAIATNNKSGISILQPIESFTSKDVHKTYTYKGPKTAGNVSNYGGGNANATIPQPIVSNTTVNKTSSNVTSGSVVKKEPKVAAKSENSMMQSTAPNSIAQPINPLTSADGAQSANIPTVDHSKPQGNIFVKGTLKSGTFIVNANGKTGNPIKEPVLLKIVPATKNLISSSSTSTTGALASNWINQDETNKSSNPNMTDSQKARSAANLLTFDASGKSVMEPVTGPLSQTNEAAIQSSKICTHDFPATNNTTNSCNKNVYFADDTIPPLVPLRSLLTNAPQHDAVLTPIGTNIGKHQLFSINRLTTSKVVRKVPAILKRSAPVLQKPGTNSGNAPTSLWYLVPASLPLQTLNENVATQLQPNLVGQTLQPMPQTQKSQASHGVIKVKDFLDRPL